MDDIGSTWLDEDLYRTLGVPSDADAATITSAYRRAARRHHPDAGGDGAVFADIAAAYEVLGDPERRRRYDELRSREQRHSRPSGHTGRPSGFDTGGWFADGFDPSFLSDAFGGTADLHATLTLDFVDAARGTTLPLTIDDTRTCPSCAGSGAVATGPAAAPAAARCDACGGTGALRDTRTVTVRIPAGVRDGQTIRIAGGGRAGRRGRGDLLVAVAVTPHPVFSRDGDHLRCRVEVPFTTAALGGTAAVPTLDGAPLTVTVPPGTSSGTVLRVRGVGIATAQRRGDLLATVAVTVPGRLDDHQRALLDQLAATLDPATAT